MQFVAKALNILSVVPAKAGTTTFVLPV